MTIAVHDKFKEQYETGFLNFALSTYMKFDTIEEWDNYLNTEPVANFINHKDYTLVHGTKDIPLITYKAGTEDEEQYEPTAVITHSNEIVYHSLYASPSMFFRHNPDSTITMLYVD